jgi:monofunctional biosynthetic peptidoglycan transglycosylase
VAQPQAEQGAAAETTALEPVAASAESSADVVERPVEEVHEAAIAEQAAEPEPVALVRDVLIIDPSAAVAEPIAEPPVTEDVAVEATPAEATVDADGPSHAIEPDQRPSSEIDALAAEAEPLSTAAEALPPVHEEPVAAATPEPRGTNDEQVADAPLPSLRLPQAIPTPSYAAPAIVWAPRAPEIVSEVETAPVAATVNPLVPEILAPSPQPASPQLTSPPPPPISTSRSHSVWPGRLRRAALILIGLVVGYAVLVLSLIVAYRWIDPPRSALMIANHLTGEPVLYAPVPITRISSYLQRAVVTSEDARFCYHRGVDWPALYEAMNESRGGSTITMQTAKNLFLWPSRSYIRKAIEIPVAMTIDALWPKRRILEVYLNIAEWGPGIFGAEAAAHYHFDKPASRLTAHEAALLAASLPNPIARDAGEPGRVTEILASRLRARLGNSDAFVRCLGLRSMRPAPIRTPRKEPKVPQKAAPKAAATKAEPKIPPWQTTTDPAFNPWQN